MYISLYELTQYGLTLDFCVGRQGRATFYKGWIEGVYSLRPDGGLQFTTNAIRSPLTWEVEHRGSMSVRDHEVYVDVIDLLG